MFAAAHDRRTSIVGVAPAEGAAIHDRIFRLFDLDRPPPAIVVTPVCIRDRVVCLYYAHGRESDAVPGLEKLADAAAATFVRLIRTSKRPGAPH
jgi:hypothetical protein